MSDIFISYKREEQATARKLANALESEGWTVWWDPKLRAGERFNDVIERALKESKCVVVMWSKRSVESSYVKDEATYALAREKLVPVKIEEVEELPFRFHGLHTPSLVGWDGSQESSEFGRLIDDISAILGRSSAAAVDAPAPPRTVVNKSQRWWQTVPAIWAAVGVAIVALTALVVALHQTASFDGKRERGLQPRVETKPLNPLQPPSEIISRPSSISGIWVGGTGRYTVTQEGNDITWDGIGTYGNMVWHHKGKGNVEGNVIIARIYEGRDSRFPGVEGGAPTEGSISADGQTISWTGQNDQERIWHRSQ